MASKIGLQLLKCSSVQRCSSQGEALAVHVNEKVKQRTKRTLFSIIVAAPPKFDVAHAGPVTGRTSEAMELVCEAVGDDHIRQVEIWKSFMFSGPRNSSNSLSE